MHSAVLDRHVWFLVFASVLCSHFFSTQFRDDPVPHDGSPPDDSRPCSSIVGRKCWCYSRLRHRVPRDTGTRTYYQRWATLHGTGLYVPMWDRLCICRVGPTPNQLGVGSGLARVGSGVCRRTHNVHTADTRQGCLSVVAVPGIPWHLHGIAPRRLGIACQSTLHYRALALAGTSAAQPSASCTTPDPSHSCIDGDWAGVSFCKCPTGGFATSHNFDSACAEHTASAVVVVAQQCCSDSAYTAGEGTR